MDRLKMLHKWYGAGIINPDAPTQKDAVKGRAFFSAQGSPGAEVGWQVNEGVEKYDTVQVFGPLYTNGTIQGSLNAVSSNSSYKKEALKLLQLVNTDRKLRDMLAFGVEGTDFEYANSERTVVKRLTDTWQIGNYWILLQPVYLVGRTGGPVGSGQGPECTGRILCLPGLYPGHRRFVHRAGKLPANLG